MPILDIVIVTYNRLEKLKKTLQHYYDQTEPFRNLIIVNNCSTDGTNEYLDEWIETIKKQGCPKFSPVLITAEENLGGSGGFYLGQKKAMELGADWVMVADDDAYAEPDMVEKFYKFVVTNRNEKFAAVCATVHKPGGIIDISHRECWRKKGFANYIRVDSSLSDYSKNCFCIDIFSYVGTFLNVDALRQYGLVRKDYFIYYDDTEHSFRLSRYGPIIVLSNITIVHDCASSKHPSLSLATWMDYYYSRNSMHMLLRHYPMLGLRYLWRDWRDWFILRKDRGMKASITHQAFIDALFNRMGKHPVYRPGWQAE